MNILVISNYYPPHYIGGYEIGCQEAVNGLRERGHKVMVLTSNHRIKSQDNKISSEVNVCRQLKLSNSDKKSRLGLFIDLLLVEIWNHICLQWILCAQKPDIVYIWNMSGISISLIFILQRMKIKTAYFVFDTWISRWEQDRWQTFLNIPTLSIKGKLRDLLIHPFLWFTGSRPKRSHLNLDGNVQFASHYLRDNAIKMLPEIKHPSIILWGLNIEAYPYKKENHLPHRILYVGQVIQHKGVHTAIKALDILVNKENLNVRLTIAGAIMDLSYGDFLGKLIISLGLEKNVTFTGFYNRGDLITVYQDHDILIFPSTWNEPFGITLLEGMASGLPVVSTANGGSREILHDGFNSLIFPTNDYQICARQIFTLINDFSLFQRIRKNARNYVENHHSLDATIDNINMVLTKLIARI
jgi:glycogen(starch) synthase